MIGFDTQYLMLVLIPGLLLGGLATLWTKTTFARYSRVQASSGLTGFQAARHMLDSQGLHDVGIERVGGFLSDHYDPRSNVLRLSPGVHDSSSLSAIGVACHEAGHALQKAHNYTPLSIRSALVPVTQIGSSMYIWLIVAGAMINSMGLIKIGIGLFGFAVLFSLVTLPVEWNASSRAKALMVSTGIVRPEEAVHAGNVLNAAFMTYLASAITAVLTLLYWLMKLGLLGNNNRN